MHCVYVWPDKSWVYSFDYCEVEDAWRGDDYEGVHVPKGLSHDEINVIVTSKNKEIF